MQRVIDRAVLIQKRVPRGPLFEHDGPIVEHPFAQQIIHRSHHMQHDDVVARLNNRQMKVGVEPCLVARVALGLRQFHFFKDRVDHFEVCIGPKPRGPLSCQALHVAPKADVVEHCLVVGRKKCHKRGRECVT